MTDDLYIVIDKNEISELNTMLQVDPNYLNALCDAIDLIKNEYPEYSVVQQAKNQILKQLKEKGIGE